MNETNPINNEVISVEKKLSKKTSIIATIIASILVIYAFSYTTYYIFIVPDLQKEEESQTENNETITKYLSLASTLVDYVPFNNIEESAYDTREKTINDLSNSQINNFLIDLLVKDNQTEEITEQNEFTEEYCENLTNCFKVSLVAMENTFKTYFGENYILNKDSFYLDNLVQNKCESDDNYFYCSTAETAITYEKYSKIVSVKYDDNYIYIYENPVFVTSPEFTLDNNISTALIKEIKSYPSNTAVLFSNKTYSATNENIELIVLNDISSSLLLYEHIFKINGNDNYTWQSTNLVNSTNEME